MHGCRPTSFFVVSWTMCPRRVSLLSVQLEGGCFTSPLLDFRCCLRLYAILGPYKYHSSVSLHGNLSVRPHSTALLPIPPCCTRPMSYIHTCSSRPLSPPVLYLKLFTLFNSSPGILPFVDLPLIIPLLSRLCAKYISVIIH